VSKLLDQARRILQPNKDIEVVSSLKPSVFATEESLKQFLSKKCKLKFGPHGSEKAGISEAWVDGRPGSACMKRYKHLTEPLPEGKWGVLILESRGAGKSTGAVTTAFGNIYDDPTETHIYSAQSLKMAIRRVKRVEKLIKANCRHLYNKDDWSNEQFTVLGADITSEDPTMAAAAPDADIEGAHARKYWLDDIVSDKSNSTTQKRRKAITWFEQLQKQFTPTTTVRAIGTRHKHHNLWEEIIDHYEDEFVIYIMGCYDEDTGERFYPWMSDEYLANKEKHDPQGFQMSFQNKKVRVDDVVFEPGMMHYGEPPTIPDDKVLGGRALDQLKTNLYMLTDFAQSSRNAHGTSETAFVILAKDYSDTRYILDIDIGRYESDVAQTRFLMMYAKWRRHGLLYATIEDRGPGRSHCTTIPQLAKASDEYDFIPAIVLLGRSNDESKVARISQMYGQFSQGKFQFSQNFLPHEMFRIDSKGFPRGVAAERLLNYAEDGDEPKDFPDALADEGHISKKGPICPAPKPQKVRKASLTDREWAERKALGKLARTIVI